MANKPAKATSSKRNYWAEQISKQIGVYGPFHTSGDLVVDHYRIEKSEAAGGKIRGDDRYNILYSSTETARPSLYAQTPKVEARARHRDRKNPRVRDAIGVLESVVQYSLEQQDFDSVMENAVEDFLLPGMGNAWVRYDPAFSKQGETEIVSSEEIAVDYVNWKDILYGPARTWSEMPWVARRVYMDKEEASERFGADKANAMSYSDNNRSIDGRDDRDTQGAQSQAVIWEIWDKRRREAVWFSESYPNDVLDVKSDPLKLRNFFPCPRPLRAISNTRKFTPRPFYAQYQAQAEEMNNLTKRIRHLTNALNVRGVYDGSMEKLANVLATEGGNKMIPVENWQQFVQNGGLVGSIQWVPIKDVAAVLMQLLQARDQCKAEIYEITGFSDIVRGQSKASETLGAQEIKTAWASGRLKVMQKEVQRFARDIIRIMAEIASEHLSVETLALYSGFEAPPVTAEYITQAEAAVQAGQQVPPDPRQQAVEKFNAVVALLKAERERCALIGIETDSTILPDEAAERKDRMDFLGAAGAFMQQAGPLMQTQPDLAPLLLAMLMFTVRTFPAARSLEGEFEKYQEMMLNKPPTDPNAQTNADGAAKAKAAVEVATVKTNADKATAQGEQQLRRYEIDTNATLEREKERNRHDERMAELNLKDAELRIKEAELRIKEAELRIKEAELNIKKQDSDVRAETAQATVDLKAEAQQDNREQAEAARADAAAERQSGPPEGAE